MHGIGEIHFQKVEPHNNGCENVVEVVGDAAGESADAFHPLGAQKLSLEFFLRRDVGIDNQR